MRILTGTASWTDPTLLACGRFYPPGVRSPEARLRYYASRFPMVEVDATYYRLLDGHTAYLWANRTPDDFVFHVKAFRLFTGHATPLATLPPDIRRELDDTPTVFYHQLPASLQHELWQRFLMAVEPLRMAGKLRAIHFQFAPWVHRSPRSVALLRACKQHMQGHLMAVEFRHRSWFHTGTATTWTLDFLRDAGMVHTVVDAPQIGDNTVPAVWASTHPDLAVLRLHGRNKAAWNSHTQASSGRFQYEYSSHELAQIAERLKRLAEHVRSAHAVLNTNHEDQGMRNAAGLAAALRDKK